MAQKIQPYISKLTASHRVVLLGGLAVIAHGFSRNTKDVDIWLDPLAETSDWLDIILEISQEFDETPGVGLLALHFRSGTKRFGVQIQFVASGPGSCSHSSDRRCSSP